MDVTYNVYIVYSLSLVEYLKFIVHVSYRLLLNEYIYLQKQRRSKLQQPVSKSADGGSTSASVNHNQQSSSGGQHLLQALASLGSSTNPQNTSGPSQETFPAGDGQIDVANVMSQVLDSPALNGLLSGVSRQTGVGSPDVLRNMLQQFTQSPQMRNTVNQIVQQVGSQDMGNIFAGMESGQGGGIDLSRMFQQMMPIVSQALGGGISSQPFSAAEREPPQAAYRERTLGGNENSNNQNVQVCISLLPGLSCELLIYVFFWFIV